MSELRKTIENFPKENDYKCYCQRDNEIYSDSAKLQECFIKLEIEELDQPKDALSTEINSSKRVCLYQNCEELFTEVLENPAKLVWMLDQQHSDQQCKIKYIKLLNKAEGGCLNDNRIIEITYQDESKMKVILKIKSKKSCEPDQEKPRNYWSKINRWREAGFYRDIYPEKLSRAIKCPRTLLAIANPATTQFLIVIEFVEGSQNVINFLRENREIRQDFDNMESEAFCKMEIEEETMIMGCVKALARMHAATWNDQSLLKYNYLAGADWMQIQGHQFFKEAVEWSQNHYKSIVSEANPDVLYDENPFVMSLLEAQCARLNYTEYTEELVSQNFSLVHNDPHICNLMWNKDAQEATLIDFEFAAIGNPLQDLAYFLFSPKIHEPELYSEGGNQYGMFRLRYEQRALQVYYDELCAANNSIRQTYSFEQMRKDYVRHWYSKRYLHDLGNLKCEEKRDQLFQEYQDFAMENDVNIENMPGVALWIS